MGSWEAWLEAQCDGGKVGWGGGKLGDGAYSTDDVLMVGQVGFTRLATVDLVAVEICVVG